MGTRIGDENDLKDFVQRKDFFEKYGKNVEVLNIETEGGISGTKAREAAQSKEEFFKYLPDELSEEEKDLAFDYVKSVIYRLFRCMKYFGLCYIFIRLKIQI